MESTVGKWFIRICVAGGVIVILCAVLPFLGVRSVGIVINDTTIGTTLGGPSIGTSAHQPAALPYRALLPNQ